MVFHEPVLLEQCLEGLNIKPDGKYVDLTFGGGGHSRGILNSLKNGKIIGFDQDDDAKQNIINDKRFLFVKSNFRFFYNYLQYHKIGQVDGILADLGVSSHHLNAAERGFSFRFDTDLDMRMNQNANLSAQEVLNQYDKDALSYIFYRYGELKNARKISLSILNFREEKAIKTTQDFSQALKECVPKYKENKFWAKVYQAIRIEVNNEIKTLQDMLQQTLLALNPNGRLVVLTYHSIEDRLVKNFMRSGNFEGKIDQDLFGKTNKPFKLINRSVIIPDESEILRNSRARSAKLRIAEKL